MTALLIATLAIVGGFIAVLVRDWDRRRIPSPDKIIRNEVARRCVNSPGRAHHLHRGDEMAKASDPVERFWRNVDRTDTCWLWTGKVGKNGYGYISVHSRYVLVHRFAHELLIGPIPEGLHVDHLCRQRTCVRPDHLEAVTQQENNRRQAEANKRTHCLHGHALTPDNVGSNGPGRTLCKACNRAKARRNQRTRRR